MQVAQDINARGNLRTNALTVGVPCQPSVSSCTIRATSASLTGKRARDETGLTNGSSR
ncbi:hypothetical protein J6590_068198 [Homalodisca vitripennis]|nr:hypothetical protein J6590_068198 [Homalodisca vitripennis]